LSIFDCAVIASAQSKIENPRFQLVLSEVERIGLQLDRVAPDLVVERWPLNAEQLGGFLFVSRTLG